MKEQTFMKELSFSMSPVDRANISDITFGTTAKYAYDLYRAKKDMLHKLQYECDLLIDKYHSEMCKAHIPLEFHEIFLLGMFDKEKEVNVATSRHMFLEAVFSKEFLAKNHKIGFVRYEFHGYGHTAIGIILGIGDYEYTIQIPLPENVQGEDKERLMGDMQFRVDRIHKSHKDDFVKNMESVCMPTYDWKLCFSSIESLVSNESPKKINSKGDNRGL